MSSTHLHVKCLVYFRAHMDGDESIDILGTLFGQVYIVGPRSAIAIALTPYYDEDIYRLNHCPIA